MKDPHDARPVAIVTGAAGQDGFFLIEGLVRDGYVVHGTVRRGGSTFKSGRGSWDQAVVIHELDLEEPAGYAELIAALRPDEFYNLAGMSSVATSFVEPAAAWRTNADAVEAMLEAIRKLSPATRFYQSSSSEMFGSAPGQESTHDEDSPLRPQSPYAAAKAAAHVLCAAYRRAYDLRIACGILFNHESSRRPATFLTRKVVDHVRALRGASRPVVRQTPPLAMGNLAARRDWGFAPDYVDGIRQITGQIKVRARVLGGAPEQDRGSNYRDYVLGTGELHAVWDSSTEPSIWPVCRSSGTWPVIPRGGLRGSAVHPTSPSSSTPHSPDPWTLPPSRRIRHGQEPSWAGSPGRAWIRFCARC